MKRKEFFMVLILLCISLILIWPLFHYGFPPTHDGEYHVVRGYQFDKTLRDGNWYPRWLPDLNYGYGTPLMNYYYPLPYYVMSLLHALGIGFINGFKISIIIAVFIGAFFFYLFSRMFWGVNGGFLSSIIYTFSPYHIVTIYVRGSVGEVWSLALFPGFLWSITKVIKAKRIEYVAVSAILFALVVFSHNITAIMFLFFSLFYCSVLVFQEKRKNKVVKLMIASIVLGVGLASIFWVPALFERQYVRGLLIHNVDEHFTQLYQLIFPSWGSGFSNTDPSNQMSTQIGIVNLLGVVGSLFVIVKHIIKSGKLRSGLMLLFFFGSFLVVLFFMLRVSFPLYTLIPFFNYFQFPWRFLGLEILITSFLAGSIVSVWNSRIFLALVVIVTLLLTIKYTIPAYYWERDDDYYFARSNFMDGTNTPGNIFNTIWFNATNERQREKFKIIEGEGRVIANAIRSTAYRAIVQAETPMRVQVNTAYFPGWNVFVDKVKIPTSIADNGLMLFSVGKGSYVIEVKFQDTKIRKIAKVISIISLSLAIFIFVRWKKVN